MRGAAKKKTKKGAMAVKKPAAAMRPLTYGQALAGLKGRLRVVAESHMTWLCKVEGSLAALRMERRSAGARSCPGASRRSSRRGTRIGARTASRRSRLPSTRASGLAPADS